MKPTAAIHFDTRRTKGTGKCPLKIKITYLRQRRYYRTGYDLTPEEWDKMNGLKPRKEIRDIRDKVSDLLKQAEAILDGLDPFSFPAFERQYHHKSAQSLELVNAFTRYITELEGQGRIGTAESYRCSMMSLTGYKRIKLTDISPGYLQGYEQWMLKKGNSLTTIGIYLRSLRAIINNAIQEGHMKPEQYPFGRRKYLIPGSKNIKKALTLQDISKLYYYPAPAEGAEDKARDFWIFSYLASGMNFKDICLLCGSNIQQDIIVFHRAKTERTKRSNPVPIVVVLNDDLRRIISKWGNPNGLPDEFIFPILAAGMNGKQQRDKIKQFTKNTNKWLNCICGKIGITARVTTYAARHSFSTILKNSGTPIEYIKDSLGHSSTLTTESYLSSYPDAVKRKFSELLTVFKEVS
jgi:integrase